MPELWTPEKHVLESKWRQPTKTELEQYWIDLQPERRPLLDLPEGVYGVCHKPDVPPQAFAVLDLCEVVRDSALAVAAMHDGSLENVFNEDDAHFSDYGTKFLNLPRSTKEIDYITILVQELMDQQQVKAVPFHEAIAAFMERWRAANVYIVADTSTLPGCEKSTIDFLDQYYKNCFDGILLPGNHNGNGRTTKAEVFLSMRSVMSDELEANLEDIPIVQIEDTPHHVDPFFEGQAFEHMKTFMPVYDWNERLHDTHPHIRRVNRGFGTVDSFIAADKHFKSIGLVGRS